MDKRINIVLLVVSAVAWISTVLSLLVGIGLVWYMKINCSMCLYTIWYTTDNCIDCLYIAKVMKTSWTVFVLLLMLSIIIEVVRFFVKDCRKDQSNIPLLSDYDIIEMNSNYP